MDLVTPTGFRLLPTTRDEVVLPPEYLRMVYALAESSAVVDLGLHCSRCQQDVTGRNGSGDRRWIMECACRTFIGGNPLPTAGST